MPKKLYRSRTNKMIAGICGGLAEYMDADPTVIRLVAALLVLAGGLSIWAYLIAWIIIPEQPVA
jgi:phage shock protein C